MGCLLGSDSIFEAFEGIDEGFEVFIIDEEFVVG